MEFLRRDVNFTVSRCWILNLFYIFVERYYPNIHQRRYLDGNCTQHSSTDVPVAAFYGLDNIDAILKCFAAIMIKQLKHSVHNLQSFSIPEDLLSSWAQIETMLYMESRLPSILKSFPSVSALVLVMIIP